MLLTSTITALTDTQVQVYDLESSCQNSKKNVPAWTTALPIKAVNKLNMDDKRVSGIIIYVIYGSNI